MTATRTILLALICSAASVTLAAQEAEGDASKKEEASKTEKTESLVAAINDVLAKAREDGTLEALSIKYFGEDLTKAE